MFGFKVFTIVMCGNRISTTLNVEVKTNVVIFN